MALESHDAAELLPGEFILPGTRTTIWYGVQGLIGKLSDRGNGILVRCPWRGEMGPYPIEEADLR